MKRIIYGLLALCLLYGCGNQNMQSIDDKNGYNADFFQVNELGIFGMISQEGIGYYDYDKQKNILIKNMDDMNMTMIQGVCLYQNQLYYFDNREQAKLMVMDVNGKNVKEQYDFSSDKYQYVYTQYKYGYIDDKIIFELVGENYAENSMDSKSYKQIAMMDLKTNTFIPITKMEEVKPLKSINLLSYSANEILYYEKEQADDVMSMQEYIDKEGSSLFYHQYIEDDIKTSLYRYDMQTKEVTKLWEDNAIEFETNCMIDDHCIYYRQHDSIYCYDLDTKQKTKVLQDHKLYLINSVLGNQIFYMCNDGKTNEYCSYHIEKKDSFVFCTTDNNGNNMDRYFIPTFETEKYYVGLSGEKMRSIVTKESYFKGDYDAVISIGW